MNSDKTLYGVVMGSEERSIDEIDLYSELLEDGVLFFENTDEILEHHKNSDSLEKCKIFTLTFGEFGQIINNPKIISFESLKPKSQKSSAISRRK